ncbi:MAG: hypothetical protein K0V04_18940 [Deltaproteobacteria bacterium]|nr:hypothetical protein [Deltaproteobacteria bacterium]
MRPYRSVILAFVLPLMGCSGDSPGPANDSTETVGATDDSGGSTRGSSPGTAGPTTMGTTGQAPTGGQAETTAGPGNDSTGTGGAADTGMSTGPGRQLNLLVNPSLEDWAMAAEPNTTPDGWTNCSGNGIAVDAVPDSCTGSPMAAADGIRYARAYDDEGIAQTLTTTIGATYGVSFSYCGVDGCFGGSTGSQWDVVVDGVVISSTPTDVGTTWTEAYVEFVARSSETTICFIKPDGVTQGGIDDLAVVEQ